MTYGIPLQTVTPYSDGEAVNAATENARINAIVKNLDILANAIAATRSNEEIVFRNVVIESAAANRGCPVTFDATLSYFVRAANLPGKSVVWGVVSEIYTGGGSTVIADVTIAGAVPLSSAERLLVFNPASPAAGLVNLSTSLGFLTDSSIPLVSPIVVGRYANGILIVNPANGQLPPASQRFPMVCEPAGIHVDPGVTGPHVITSPNPTLPGWLPASSFSVVKPVGAKFGYNIAADPVLNTLFSSLAVGTAWVEHDRGNGGVGLPPEFIQVTSTGIWWMTNCNSSVPWPTHLTTNGVTRPVLTLPAPCPVITPMRMTLWAARPASNLASAVLSLTGQNGVVVTDADGNPATSGDLIAKLAVSATPARGATGLRALVSDGVQVGPVVEAIQFGPGFLVVSTDPTVQYDPLDPTQGTANAGTLKVSLLPATLQQLTPARTWFDGTGEDRDASNIYAITFPATRASATTSRYDVPTLSSSANLRLNICLRGVAAGSVPNLTVKIQKVSRPAPGSPSVAVPSTFISGTTGTGFTWTNPLDVVTIVSSPFSVSSGDVLFITVTRGTADGYSSDVGLINQFVELVP